MSTNEWVDYFIGHSPGFHGDLELENIDEKHTNILKESYQQIKSGEAFNKTNFRNWKGQSDLAVPSQLSLRSMRSRGFVKYIIRYVFRKLFRRNEEKLLLSSLLDDIDVIKSLKGEELLIENPVHITPGVSDYYKVNQTSVNFRWLRYIYILKKILDQNLLSDDDVWVDVGSYYGGLQGLVRKYRPKSRIVMVDFHHQLCRSYIYLSSQYPDAIHIMPDQLLGYKDIQSMPEGSFMYVPVSEYKTISDQSVDLVTNFFSLGEMKRAIFSSYMNSRLFRESEKVFLVNRFVSAPFFEKTYDTDLIMPDYLSEKRGIGYYDVFPMHHYLLIKRELFGRESFRNFSSSYFEMITSRAIENIQAE